MLPRGYTILKKINKMPLFLYSKFLQYQFLLLGKLPVLQANQLTLSLQYEFMDNSGPPAQSSLIHSCAGSHSATAARAGMQRQKQLLEQMLA